MIYRTLLLLTIHSKDWLIRARALAIQTNADGTSNEMGGSVKTGDDLIPEIDITYYLADNISVETMFGIAEYNVQLDGSALGCRWNSKKITNCQNTTLIKFRKSYPISELVPVIRYFLMKTLVVA